MKRTSGIVVLQPYPLLSCPNLYLHDLYIPGIGIINVLVKMIAGGACLLHFVVGFGCPFFVTFAHMKCGKDQIIVHEVAKCSYNRKAAHL